MSEKLLRGSVSSQEIREDHIVRDTRGVVTKAAHWLKVPNNLAMLLIVFAAVAFLFPGIADFCLVFSSFFVLFGLTREESAPLKLPLQSGLMDKNERHPATGRPTPAAGIFFLGNEVKTGKEVWLTNSDCRQHFLVLGTTGSGKALPLDARVHTPTGWKAMGDIRVGEAVTAPDGRSARVLGYYPQGELDICRITFADGRTAEACPDHLWEVSGGSGGEPRLLRTREMSEALERDGAALSVRLAHPVEKPEARLPVDPYLYGRSLGRSGRTADVDLSDAIRRSAADRILHALGDGPVVLEAPLDVRANLLAAEAASVGHRAVSSIGVEGRISIAGFMPETAAAAMVSAVTGIDEAYMEGSASQRWALAQGLMDACGEIGEDCLSFVSPSERLARDFREVVWSLGGTATLSIGPQGHIVRVRHPDPSRFFSDPAMASAADRLDPRMEELRLGVVSVETMRRAEAACILIDHPDHLFITDNYVVTHNTEALLGFAANAIAWGSGFLFCDGKGDVSLFAKVYALTRRFGREDDLLVLNYMTGNQDLGSSGGKLRSNTLNPFATGSSDTLTQMVVGLMDDAGGDGAMWKGRATAMFTGVMRALTWLRDRQFIDLNVGEIRDHLNLKRIIDLADQSKYQDMPQPIRKSINSYLTSLPGFQPDKGYKQSQTTLDQHGYLEMQFTKILGSLADVYGHIFHTPYGEIDMADVVLNRRILVIMLPALEKSGDEIANLGKIVVATLKGMMGGTLGSEIEGTWDAVVENRPTNSPSPFIVILDEVGYYMVEGMDLMAAQARSLGFALFFAGQDLNAMKRFNEKVFGSVQGNTSTKLIMKTEDPDTAKIAIEAAGKAYRAHLSGYQGQVKEVGDRAYSDSMEAKLDYIERINLRDLRDQDPGEMHVIHKDTVVRMKSFYAAPETAVARKNLTLRANHFITVAKPDPEEIASQQRLPEIVQKLADPDFARAMKAAAATEAQNVGGEGEIALIARTLAQVDASTHRPSSPLEAACIAFASLTAANKVLDDGYAKDVRGSAGPYRPRMPDDEDEFGSARPQPARPRPVRPQVDRDTPFDGFAADAPRRSDAMPDIRDSMMPEDFVGPEEVRARPRPPAHRPFNGGRVRPNVTHGVQMENGGMHDFADRIASNESVMRTLAALDFDEKTSTKESVDNGIEEALSILDEGDPVDSGPFETGSAGRAAAAIHGAMPDFDDDVDDGGDQGGPPPPSSFADEFLSSLISDEEE